MPFSLTVFPEALSLFFCKFSGLFLLWALGVSEAHVSLVGGLTQLTAALIKCDKPAKL